MRKPKHDRAAIEPVILAALASGQSLRSICAEIGLAPSTFSEWLLGDADLAERYARAREAQADLYESEIIELSDQALQLALKGGEGVSAIVQAAKIQVDNRKWVLERMRQGRWGASLRQELSGPNGGQIQHTITVEAVAAPTRRLLPEAVERED